MFHSDINKGEIFTILLQTLNEQAERGKFPELSLLSNSRKGREKSHDVVAQNTSVLTQSRLVPRYCERPMRFGSPGPRKFFFSRPFVSDTSPKSIDQEGLERRLTGKCKCKCKCKCKGKCKHHIIHSPQGFSGIIYNTGWGTLPDCLRCSLQVMKE